MTNAIHQYLDLSFKGLSTLSFDKRLDSAAEVLVLNLRGNSLRELGAEIAYFPNLRELDLSNNKISTISESIQHLRDLERLILDENDFSTLPTYIFRLTRLRILSIASNCLSRIDREIFRLANLEHLDLWGNQLETFPSFNGLRRLRTINLGANALHELPEDIIAARSLEVISLNGNNLRELPSAIGWLPALRQLHINSNCLPRLPSTLGNAPKLEQISMRDNPFESPLAEIWMKGTSAVKAYLRTSASSTGTSIVHEARLVFLGDPDVGKSSIVERLANDVFRDYRDPTAGVKITSWNMRAPDKDIIIHTNVWDFGGQEIYHSTHKYFLGKGSTFVIVIDSSRSDIDGRLDYWLSTISAVDAIARVLIVANKLDEGSVNVDMASLAKRFPAVGGFFRISCKFPKLRGNQLIDLKMELAASCWERSSSEWPNEWLQIRAALEEEVRPYLLRSQYLRLCERHNVDAESAISLATYLHEVGIVLSFQEDSWLSNVLIRDPEWATRPVYELLGSQSIRARGGRLTEAHLTAELVNLSASDPIASQTILCLMLKFGLMYKLPGGDGYVVPELLPNEKPSFPQPKGNWASFQCTYRFIPPGLIASLIIKSHDEIWRPSNGGPLHWRYGLIIGSDDACADISVERASAVLRVVVVGSRIERLRSRAQALIEAANRIYPGIDAKLGVPCRCSEGCSHIFSFQFISDSQAGDFVACDATQLKVNIGLLKSGEISYISGTQRLIGKRSSPRSLVMNIQGDVNMSDKFEAKRDVYAIGSNSAITNSNVQLGRTSVIYDCKQLANELSELVAAMRKDGLSPVLVDIVDKAHKDAVNGNEAAATAALKTLGKETYEISKKIGVPIIIEILKNSLGF